MGPSKSFSLSMAPFYSVMFVLSCLCLLSVAFSTPSFHEELAEFSFLDIGSSLCEIAKCVKGQCVNSSTFPFYHCNCNSGWASPFGRSWLPCILPNCSIDFTCGNTTSAAPAPPPTTAPLLSGTFDFCSLPVCGNGECVRNSSASNSSDDYQCQCDTGYVNLRNQSDGYCVRECALGDDCANLGLPLGGTSPPPPPSLSSPSSSSSSNVNQGQMNALHNKLFVVAILGFAIMWA